MAGDAAWRFDPIPASGSITGGAAETFVFRPQLSSFVREVLQNSHDQRRGDAPVHVDFVFHEYRPGTEERQRVEDALGWHTLGAHLGAVAEGDSTFSLRVRQALEALADGPLLCLEIRDRRTRGLNGDEFERGANFAALCRNVLDTPPGTTPGRGGSYGLGKAVLWLYSSISTILFSSRLSEPEREGQLRFIGRSVLPYHELDGSRWSGLGWLGAQDTNEFGQERSVSIWGDDAGALCDDLEVEPPPRDETGTSILVAGFREPYLDGSRPPEEIAPDVLLHASRWFWPAITNQPPTLTVSASVFRDGEQVWSDVASRSSEISHFVTARSADAVQATARTSGDVAEREIHFRVPATKVAMEGLPTDETGAVFRLRLIRSDQQEHEFANTVALIRGAGMVVDYKSWGRRPGDGRPYFAVLEAGLAHGAETSDRAAEAFLRASEPPAHDDWDLTDAVRTRYQQGGLARLRELQSAVRGAIADICEEDVPASAQGPALLARLLPLGRKGGQSKPPGPQFRTEFNEGSFSEDRWRVQGTVTRLRGEGPWQTTVRLSLDVESGRPEPVELESCQASAGGEGLTVHSRQESAVVAVPWDTDEFTFVALTSPLTDSDARRTRIDADIRPRLGEGES